MQLASVCKQNVTFHATYKQPLQSSSDQNNHKEVFGAVTSLQQWVTYSNHSPNSWKYTKCLQIFACEHSFRQLCSHALVPLPQNQNKPWCVKSLEFCFHFFSTLIATFIFQHTFEITVGTELVSKHHATLFSIPPSLMV